MAAQRGTAEFAHLETVGGCVLELFRGLVLLSWLSDLSEQSAVGGKHIAVVVDVSRGVVRVGVAGAVVEGVGLRRLALRASAAACGSTTPTASSVTPTTA